MFSTLRSTRDIRAVLAARRTAHGRALSVHARPAAGPPRAAIVAGRSVGGAVQRNRAKRRLRSVVSAAGLVDGADVVVVAKAPAVSVPFAALVEEYSGLRQRIRARLGFSHRPSPG